MTRVTWAKLVDILQVCEDAHRTNIFFTALTSFTFTLNKTKLKTQTELTLTTVMLPRAQSTGFLFLTDSCAWHILK